MAVHPPVTRLQLVLPKDIIPSLMYGGRRKEVDMQLQSIVRHHLKRDNIRVLYLAEQCPGDTTSLIAADVIASGKATQKQLGDCANGLIDALAAAFQPHLQKNDSGLASVSVRVSCSEVKPYDASREI